MAALIHIPLPGGHLARLPPRVTFYHKKFAAKKQPRFGEILPPEWKFWPPSLPPLDFFPRYDIISYYGQEAIYGERYIMQKIAIVTDSNSGITQAQSKQLGVWVLPMPFLCAI